MNGRASMRPIGAPGTVGPLVDGYGGPGDDIGISDEELTALALAADPMRPLDEDAMPMAVYLASQPGPLPEWYMPLSATRARRWRWPVVAPVIFAFVLIASFGLCATYGTLGWA